MGTFAWWQDARTDPEGIQRFLHVSIGLISILLAVYFGLMLLGTLFIAMSSGSAYDVDVLMWIAIYLPLTVFFRLVGRRLILGRGAKTGGGLLSPMGYRLYGVLLAFMAMNFFFRSLGETSGLLISGTLSVLCFVAAARRQRTPKPLPIQT